jgi:hypothetical protein
MNNFVAFFNSLCQQGIGNPVGLGIKFFPGDFIILTAETLSTQRKYFLAFR